VTHSDLQPAEGRKDHDLGFERLVFFSDAVFAIGITLLVLDLKLQVGPHGEILLGRLIPKLLGFVISFSVTALFWLAHHRLFKTLRAESAALRGVNLVFLASVVFLAFPSSLITEYVAQPWAVIVYALSVAVTGLLMAVLVLVARRPALMSDGETQGGTVQFLARSLSVPVVFISTCFVAPQQPLLAMLLWMLLPAVRRGMEVVGARIGRDMDQKAAASAPVS
jgi:uncharacterized membrane protein